MWRFGFRQKRSRSRLRHRDGFRRVPPLTIAENMSITGGQPGAVITPDADRTGPCATSSRHADGPARGLLRASKGWCDDGLAADPCRA